MHLFTVLPEPIEVIYAIVDQDVDQNNETVNKDVDQKDEITNKSVDGKEDIINKDVDENDDIINKTVDKKYEVINEDVDQNDDIVSKAEDNNYKSVNKDVDQNDVIVNKDDDQNDEIQFIMNGKPYISDSEVKYDKDRTQNNNNTDDYTEKDTPPGKQINFFKNIDAFSRITVFVNIIFLFIRRFFLHKKIFCLFLMRAPNT